MSIYMKINDFKKPNVLIFDNINNQLKYKPNNVSNKHPGQLKLLMTELQFFNNCNIDALNSKDRPIYVLYIGSGRGYHLIKLLDLYKDYNIKWYFYDPSGHCISLERMSQYVSINNDYFTEKNINEFKNKKPLLFISDIRSTDGSEPRTKNLIDDYKIQNNIVLNLRPLYSLLKFRYPFPDDFPPEIENEVYVDGIKFLQPFCGPQSTEMRIFVSEQNIILKNFSKEESILFEEKMYYYNKNYRIINKNDILIAGFILKSTNKFDNMKYIDIIKSLENSINNQIREDISFNKLDIK
ncbi:ORF MSV041 putative poly(A) polymerase small subunit PAP-S homolog (vaccinia J3R), similar to GB:L22579 [Melanoplus sanguinipes entomopoxvirus]|uniref:Cap-specific mRNA (nucleoside-2'-O-)-methyltransferase n=1 Tax=Melanoplus sanguinipes entomopoxvirus TaxID=83191 RepID=Q9YW51_MSEPV|nr:ORF MSV041 putative poly(A) polymerase small subunit PAP-S homolog (vaccinia J3R), similar to GB:L22579 [Melanoplus sanguinipes entomopoxvirus]AAC97833.1 ORF MSV041 putative poly(A) polymerase small subunit PAP-S homolog (vaccinia J3R), similar to GB:L22579 [Melanoplus sanguinipes entomopoxvirus 'O']